MESSRFGFLWSAEEKISQKRGLFLCFRRLMGAVASFMKSILQVRKELISGPSDCSNKFILQRDERITRGPNRLTLSKPATVKICLIAKFVRK
jgi:hypothetical protein